MVAEGEVALVDAHGDLQDLGREVHEGVVDTAEQRHGPFDEASDFVEECVVRHDGEVARFGQCSNAVGNARAAFGGVHDDAVACKCFLPLRTGGDADWAGSVKAMALGFVRRDQAMAVVIASLAPLAKIEADDLTVEQACDSAERTDPGELATCAPAHRFRPREAPEKRWQGFCDEVRGGLSRGGFVQDPVVAFLAEVVLGRAVFAEEAGQGLFRGRGAWSTLDGL